MTLADEDSYSKLLMLLRKRKMMVWKTFNSRTTAFQQFGNMLEFFGHRSEFFGLILFTLLLFGKNTQTAFGSVFFTFIPFETLESCYTEGKNRGAKNAVRLWPKLFKLMVITFAKLPYSNLSCTHFIS